MEGWSEDILGVENVGLSGTLLCFWDRCEELVGVFARWWSGGRNGRRWSLYGVRVSWDGRREYLLPSS